MDAPGSRDARREGRARLPGGAGDIRGDIGAAMGLAPSLLPPPPPPTFPGAFLTFYVTPNDLKFFPPKGGAAIILRCCCERASLLLGQEWRAVAGLGPFMLANPQAGTLHAQNGTASPKAGAPFS